MKKPHQSCLTIKAPNLSITVLFENLKKLFRKKKLNPELEVYLESSVRIKKDFFEIRAMKSEREGPRDNEVYPIPAATVMALASSLPANQQEENYFWG